MCTVQLLGEDAAKTSYFASYLREVFQPNTDPMTMEVAASTLGHLVKSGGALTADIVEFEARSCVVTLDNSDSCTMPCFQPPHSRGFGFRGAYIW